MTERIGYLGPPGTYTEQAARALYVGAGGSGVGGGAGALRARRMAAELFPYPTIRAVGSAVAGDAVDAGVVPIENSLEGSVTFTLDLLIAEPGLSIRNEVVIPIDHYLVAPPGVAMDEVQVIYSHPQALAQCRGYLEARFPAAAREASLSTVAAVADMLAGRRPAAAICPRRAAEIHPVRILARSIQDNSANQTRFVVLAHDDHARTGHDRTSICFSFAVDQAGHLYGVVGEFALRGINLVKIESRPTKRELGRYIFLIDCDGHRTDPAVAAALEGVRQRADMFKVLGSYPHWEMESSEE